MTDKQRETIEKAIQIWELGLLLFLYEKGFLTEEEYGGIRRIAESKHAEKFIVS